MIRGNYSLAKEVRKNEQKQRQKIQQRQKHLHQMQKLQLLDPIKLYFQIQKLKASHLDSEQDKRLKKLQDDWKFIEKNKLHQERLVPFLKEQARKQELKRKEESKLWGKQSVYFNPELNPLGKVPNIQNLLYEIEGPLPNTRIPLKSRTRYDKDPLIESLGVVFPDGPRPQFYKKVQNTNIEKKTVLPDIVKPGLKGPNPDYAKSLKRSSLDSDSDAEIYSDDDETVWKKKHRPS